MGYAGSTIRIRTNDVRESAGVALERGTSEKKRSEDAGEYPDVSSMRSA
jgi:hypothetical protein